jgi:hypothetical protein
MAEQHTITAGDCIHSIAAAHGHTPEKIWMDAANADLHDIREDPSMLLPGDIVQIPDIETKTVQGGTDSRHQFCRMGLKCYLQLQLLDEDYEPRSNVAYELEVDGDTRTGQTDGDGILEELIKPTTQKALLMLPDDEESVSYEILLGQVDPGSETRGVQQRLANLGLYTGEIDDKPGPKTETAVSFLQKSLGTQETGELDDTDRNMLQSLHGA